MIFNYANSGDILYGVEIYRFRYNGRAAADIKILNMIDDSAFIFEVEIEDNIKLQRANIRNFGMDNREIREMLGVEINEPIKDRKEALQMAIDWTSFILEEFSDISTKIQDNNYR
ncbi:hypothetical protein [Heyndrickxia camelliae]|uniref:Uncharacterized protein n=1 Tax=Heyndrickxia camelliae TaxID=1707093 RepID=A0A2N3LEL4_9BACI|nr:hypothetical protein [Heyndrickxia camelliae]PKR83039.1 hypothetical protein CWO92_21100 [Heyndrickxia camelliae]